MTEPGWVATSIWWHVYPLGALGADTTGRTRTTRRSLADLVDWLDHVIELGLNGIALGPIFASATHGYDTLDHYAIDDRLGTIDDFDRLIAECRRRGIRVMLDGVFNHVAHAHRLVADPDAAIASGWARRGRSASGLRTFEGHDHLVELDHRSEAVADLVVDIMCHWLARGVDAWRLDAAYRVPQPFWRNVIDRVKARHPEAYIVGEVIHGDYSSIISETGMDSLTQYELWKAIWSSIVDANMHELAWTLARNNDMLSGFTPWTFVGNHDVTRIATMLEHRHPHLALVLLATLPGTPAVYYGDEFGWQATKEERPGGDDAIRPALPATPGGELTAASTLRLHQRLIGIRRRFASVHSRPVHVDEVAAGFLRYRVGDDGELSVVLNADDHPISVDVGGLTSVDGDHLHRDGDTLHLSPGGWFIGTGRYSA